MKFNIKRTELIEVFSEFISILKDNSIKPVISGLKIEVVENQVIFSGTNLDMNYIKVISCQTLENGVVIFKPHLALEYIKLLDDELITISSDNELLSIHLAEFSLLLNENFPENLKQSIVEKLAVISPQELYTAFEKTKFSASLSAENLAINCIRILFREDYISFVSTDSYRLTYLKTKNGALKSYECSIPFEATTILSKFIKDLKSEITIGINNDNLIFEWENSYFLTKLTTLQFPNFEPIIFGNSFSKEMEFNIGELKSALKKVLTVARTSSEAKNGAILDFKGKNLLISATSGKAKINQKIEMIKVGEDFRASLNIKYLYEFIEKIDSNVIIKGNNSSSMFEISEANTRDYIYILMPLALRE